ncbi:hypothetical protein L596_024684 [Steinernema carpocapsae]|uniref:Uncharacterized protein n=1 Tax=Steinernema carpocapsae TaxID=34508 RepID=A0A4U5M5I0_STECR|nr:hypothetical protein L596_024684 [Steinernema carpocapsae]
MADNFPEIVLSLTTKQNKRLSYESRRLPGHIFSFSAGSKDSRVNSEGVKTFCCLACLAKRERLKRQLGTGNFICSVARVRVTADLKSFVEDPEADVVFSTHNCIQNDDTVEVKQEPVEELAEGPKEPPKEATKMVKRRTAPKRSTKTSNSHPEEDNSKAKRSRPLQNAVKEEIETFPAIIWSNTRMGLRQASYESPRFDGHVFRFREDAQTRNRRRTVTQPRVFECIDCSTIRSNRNRHGGMGGFGGGIAKVKISRDFKKFVEDPDFSNREHQCIALVTVHPKSISAMRAVSVAPIKEEPPTQEEVPVERRSVSRRAMSVVNGNGFSGEIAVNGSVNGSVNGNGEEHGIAVRNGNDAYGECFLGLERFDFNKPPNWTQLEVVKREHPFDYPDYFFSQQRPICDLVENYIEAVHDRFLDVVKEKHPTSELRRFCYEFQRWKPALTHSVKKFPGRSLGSKKRPVCDEVAFDLVSMFLSEGSGTRNATYEFDSQYAVIRVPFRSAINEYTIFPRVVIVGHTMSYKYIMISRQMIPLPAEMSIPECLQLLIESYVAFDLPLCPDVAPHLIFLEFIFGLQRSPMGPKLQRLLKETYAKLDSFPVE